MASARLLAQMGLMAVVLVILFTTSAEGRKKGMIECLADLEGANDDPNNIYHCNEYQTCCHEGGLPSCCNEKDTSVAVVEQAALWGTLFGVLFFVAFVMWCCRTDGNACRTQADGKQRCCCYRTKDKYENKRPPSPDTHEDLPGDYDYDDLNIDIVKPQF